MVNTVVGLRKDREYARLFDQRRIEGLLKTVREGQEDWKTLPFRERTQFLFEEVNFHFVTDTPYMAFLHVRF